MSEIMSKNQLNSHLSVESSFSPSTTDEYRPRNELKTVKCVMSNEHSSTDVERSRQRSSISVEKSNRKMVKELVQREENEGVDYLETQKDRLQKHLDWLKKKEQESIKKKENLKLEAEIRRLEDIKRAEEKVIKEREKEEKFKAWQESKLREKEERRRQEQAVRALEEKMNFAAEHVDKDRIIEEWLRVKNMQKRMENEQRLLKEKQEAEKKAMRQMLAQVSYEQWKKKAGKRQLTLPKNGYALYEAKPDPVVKEDWDRDFIHGDNSDSNRRTLSTRSLTQLGPIKENIETIGYLSELKTKKPEKIEFKMSSDGLNVKTNSRDPTRMSSLQNMRTVKQMQAELEDFKKIYSKNSYKVASKLEPSIIKKYELCRDNLLPTKPKLDVFIPFNPPKALETPADVNTEMSTYNRQTLDKLNKLKMETLKKFEQKQKVNPAIQALVDPLSKLNQPNVIKVKNNNGTGRSKSQDQRSTKSKETPADYFALKKTIPLKAMAKKKEPRPNSVPERTVKPPRPVKSGKKLHLEKVDKPLVEFDEKPKKKPVFQTKSVPNFGNVESEKMVENIEETPSSDTKALTVTTQADEKKFEELKQKPMMEELFTPKKIMKALNKNITVVQPEISSLIPIGKSDESHDSHSSSSVSELNVQEEDEIIRPYSRGFTGDSMCLRTGSTGRSNYVSVAQKM